jgi:hypothetical protein
MVASVARLSSQAGNQVFTVREVYVEMLAQGTSYAESMIVRTMECMKDPSPRPPNARLERVGRQGFRLQGAPT